MLSWSALSQFLGGLGLFLLGMWLLTEGLKLAGGLALQHYLESWTRTRLRAFFSGFALTTAVQSSSAITVAVIGFINAGLLNMSHALWVIFGSNVGSTTTAWIVVLIGFKFKIDMLALPAIGIGAILHLFSSGVRSKSLGGAVAGLGLLFLGLQMLPGAFSAIEQQIDISAWFTADLSGMLLMLVIGLVMTAMMQSSGAAMAVVLTAVATGVLPLVAGAAAVIGANLGTTITAVLAVLKATANARRIAVAHVLFNLITASVAFALLGFFLVLVQKTQSALHLDPQPAVSLALFHTVFNLLGVALMIPLEPTLRRWLAKLFLRSEAQTITPRYLDDNVVKVPDLALQAVLREQQRVLNKLGILITQPGGSQTTQQQQIDELHQLVSAINKYVVQSARQPLPEDTATALQKTISTNLHLFNCLESLQESRPFDTWQQPMTAAQQGKITTLREHINALVAACSTDQAAGEIATQLKSLERTFRDSRSYYVSQTRERAMHTQYMETCLQQLTHWRHTLRQYAKACRAVQQLANPQAAAAETPDDVDHVV